MRTRMRTIWVLALADGSQWRGDCPTWAAQPVPAGATLTRVRTLWLGPKWPCNCHA